MTSVCKETGALLIAMTTKLLSGVFSTAEVSNAHLFRSTFQFHLPLQRSEG